MSKKAGSIADPSKLASADSKGKNTIRVVIETPKAAATSMLSTKKKRSSN